MLRGWEPPTTDRTGKTVCTNLPMMVQLQRFVINNRPTLVGREKRGTGFVFPLHVSAVVVRSDIAINNSGKHGRVVRTRREIHPTPLGASHFAYTGSWLHGQDSGTTHGVDQFRCGKKCLSYLCVLKPGKELYRKYSFFLQMREYLSILSYKIDSPYRQSCKRAKTQHDHADGAKFDS